MYVAYNNFARGGKKPQIRCSDQTAVLCQLMSSARFFGGHKKAQKEIPSTTHRLSDGTLRILAIASAILSAPEGALVVVEEIDNGVHPSRARQLLDRVSRIAKEHELRVLISSHNPALLDALPDDAAPHVVFCYRNPEDGASRLVRLNDLPDYPELVAQGPVGHLMTQGIIERFVKEHPGSEERKRRAHDWLNALRRQTG